MIHSLVRQKGLGTVRIEIDDGRAKLNFRSAFKQSFTHLDRDQFGEIINSIAKEFGQRLEDRLTVVEGCLLPLAIGRIGLFDPIYGFLQ